MTVNASSDTQQNYLTFWTTLCEYLQNQGSFLEPYEATSENYLTLRICNSNFRLSAAATIRKPSIRVELEIMSNDHVDIFRALEQDKSAIESSVGYALNWREMTDMKRSIVSLHYDECDVSDTDQHEELLGWFKATLETFHDAFAPRLEALTQK